ncbi:hypothetical protein K432DRAFT_188537 [Lepidopterella palustris CBS 459.81]|uniref:Secreted protein n=1 Tax=Lepidopterella palustris CBS 459.81 TaxID=1314670 RepID=A0A8E2DZX2_9PEZI|nr:hypothetical protein K432DRAFT_188537 [Lepidopterella palustris CBS 459.81]
MIQLSRAALILSFPIESCSASWANLRLASSGKDNTKVTSSFKLVADTSRSAFSSLGLSCIGLGVGNGSHEKNELWQLFGLRSMKMPHNECSRGTMHQLTYMYNNFVRQTSMY